MDYLAGSREKSTAFNLVAAHDRAGTGGSETAFAAETSHAKFRHFASGRSIQTRSAIRRLPCMARGQQGGAAWHKQILRSSTPARNIFEFQALTENFRCSCAICRRYATRDRQKSRALRPWRNFSVGTVDRPPLRRDLLARSAGGIRVSLLGARLPRLRSPLGSLSRDVRAGRYAPSARPRP